MPIRSLGTVLVAAVVLAGCGDIDTGSAFPASTTHAGSRAADVPTYREPADSSGFSTQALDQPLPLPTMESGSAACGWLEATLPDLQPLGAVKTEGTASGCQFEMNNGQGAQVHLRGPYNRITQDTALLRPVDIAGIKGRVYAFDPPPVTFCSIELDIRAYASLKVDGYDLASDETGDRDAHCGLAQRVTEVIVKKYVPLAGGAPWPQTKQKPADDVLAKTGPCDIVQFTDVNYGGINSGRGSGQTGSTALGPSCRYQNDYASATVQIVTATSGLGALPTRADARAQDSQFGVLPARTEQTTDACLLGVQFGNGQVLQLEFKPTHQRDYAITCTSAQVILASAMATLLADTA